MLSDELYGIRRRSPKPAPACCQPRPGSTGSIFVARRLQSAPASFPQPFQHSIAPETGNMNSKATAAAPSMTRPRQV